MPGNPFYRSSFWRELREARLRLDDYRCAAPGCTRRAVVVDHIETRPDVPHPCAADRLDNTGSLCVEDDCQVKEQPGGKRRQGGQLRTRGCDAEGRSLDPNHRWNCERNR